MLVSNSVGWYEMNYFPIEINLVDAWKLYLGNMAMKIFIWIYIIEI